ncbi:MAG: polysaccharide biosynthesis C-terminal domain-containing protein [Bdellovibrionota bacterium]
MLLVALLAGFLYPILLPYVVDGAEFSESTSVFWILCAGIVVNSGYRSFIGLILQGGRPGLFTIFVASLVVCNIIFNAILIPVYGVNGAAAATAFVYLLEAILLIFVAKKYFKVRL